MRLASSDADFGFCGHAPLRKLLIFRGASLKQAAQHWSDFDALILIISHCCRTSNIDGGAPVFAGVPLLLRLMKHALNRLMDIPKILCCQAASGDTYSQHLSIMNMISEDACQNFTLIIAGFCRQRGEHISWPTEVIWSYQA